MAGLAGVIDTAGIGDGNLLLEKMLGSLRFQASHTAEGLSDSGDQWAVGRVDLGFEGSQPQPARMRGSDALVFLSGRLHFDAFERRAICSEEPSEGDCDAALLLRLYEREGGNLPPGIRGSFSAAIIDPRRNQVLIANDTIGQRPIYYSLRNSRLLFGSAMRALLKDTTLARQINQEAMADLLEYRYVLWEKTLLEGVWLLAPGSQLLYDLGSDSLQVRNNDSVDEWFSAEVDTRPRKAVLDDLSDLFASATRRICDAKLQNTVSLSGGMDSRTIMAVVQPERARVNSYTAGLPGSVDEGITRKIAASSQCENLYSEWTDEFLEPDNYLRRSRDAILLTDGMRGSSFHPMTMKLAEDYGKFEFEVVLAGHGGEFAKLDRAYGFALDPEKDLARDHEDLKNIVFEKMRNNVWDGIDRRRLFRDQSATNQQEALRVSFDREFQKIDPSLPIHQQISYFFLREYFRKHAVLSNRIHGNFSEIEYPFVAEEFVRAVLRTPLDMRLNHGIHRHIIKAHNPSLLRIPLSDTRVPLDAGFLRRQLITRPYGLLRRYGFFQTDVPEIYIPKNTPADIFDSTLLEAPCLDRGTLDATYLGEIIQRYKAGEERLFHPLNGLLAMELWARLYLDA